MRKVRVKAMKKKVFLLSICLLAGLFFAGTEISSAVYADEIKVGVWKRNGKPVYEYLNRVDGIKAEYLPRRNWIEKIYNYDVLFLSSGWLGHLQPLDSELRARLIEYVHRGHGLVLAHDSYYGKWYRQVLFPEFQTPEPGVGQRYGRAMKVIKKNHPVAKGLPSKFYQCYMEHACFKPSSAKNAELICTDGEKRPVVVTAKVGKGRVVAAGIFFALNYIEAPEGSVKNAEKLLLNSLRWAGGVKKREVKDPLLVRSSIRKKLKKYKDSYDAKLAVNEVWYKLDNELDYLYGRTEDLAIAGSKKAKQLCKEIKSLRAIAKSNYKNILKRTKSGGAYFPLAPSCPQYSWRMNILPEYTIDLLRQKVTDVYVSEGNLLKKEKKPYRPSAQEIKAALKNLRSRNPEERAKGAMEAGRMEIKNAVPRLIKLLQDRNYPVRRNSIYALSWLRDKKAVTPLMKIAGKDKDIKIRRRAIQALGMIGDRKASPLLLKLMGEKDVFIRQNVILALGYLREKQAVEKLLEIIEKPLPNPLNKNDEDYALQTAGINALGRIGGEKAIAGLRAKLKNMLKVPVKGRYLSGSKDTVLCFLCLAIGRIGEEKDIETLRNINKPRRRIYRLSALRHLPAIAISMIKEGSLDKETKEAGIIQPAFLKERENFYLAEDRFQRISRCTNNYHFRPASEQLKYYGARSAEINGFVSCCSNPLQVFPAGRYGMQTDESSSRYSELRDALDSANKCGVKIFPGGDSGVCNVPRLLYVVDLMGDSEGFGGFWSEEDPVYGGGHGASFQSDWFIEKLKGHLREKYTQEQRKKLGLKDEDLKKEILKNLKGLKDPNNEDWIEKYRILFTECLETQDEVCLEAWQEVAEWLRQQRKNTPIFYDTTTSFIGHGVSISVYGKLGNFVASSGTEPSYCAASYNNAFYADLAGDGGKNISGMEPYSYRCGTVRNYELGMGIGILHTQRFMLYTWGRTFKQPGACFCEWRGNWKEGMWEMVQRVYGNIKKVEPYLVRPEMPHGIGLVFSGRTSCTPYGVGRRESRRTRRYVQDIIGVYEVLKQSHLQFDLISMETLDKKRIRNYKVLVLPNARTLTEEEISMLERWVKKGGRLISTGSTSLCDRWGRRTKNYRLAKLLGVDYIETKMSKPENYRYYLPRDIKEEKYITSFTAPYRLNVEYDLRVGYDVVKPTSGKVTGKWADGSPAVIKNSYGKGKSIFLTGIGIGLACKYNHMQTAFPLHRTFYPGVIPLLKSIVQDSYTDSGNKLPLKVENCPLHTELLMKTQDNGKRKIIHLLNYDNENKSLIKDIKISLLWTGKGPAKVFLPVEDKELTYQREGDYITFIPGELDIWKMVVVE